MLNFGFYNMDCMEGMKQFPDDYFNLAIVDPPYGSGFTEGGGCEGWFAKYRQDNLRGGYWNRFGQRFDRYKNPQARKCGSVGSAEQGELGRRNSQKNHHVGCGSRTVLL